MKNTENIVLMRMARESLKGKWGLAIGTFLIYNLILSAGGIMYQNGGAFSAMFNIVPLILGGPLMLGAAVFSLAISRRSEAKFEQLFDGFKDFTNALLTYLLMLLFVILWTLLLIVPGIIAALSYSMTFYVLAENRSLKPREALDRSKEMMDGYKLKLFYLMLRFLLLALLCILTFGIGFLWYFPYYNVTMAKFYDDLKGDQQELV